MYRHDVNPAHEIPERESKTLIATCQYGHFYPANLFVNIDHQGWLDKPFYTENQSQENPQISLFDG